MHRSQHVTSCLSITCIYNKMIIQDPNAYLMVDVRHLFVIRRSVISKTADPHECSSMDVIHHLYVFVKRLLMPRTVGPHECMWWWMSDIVSLFWLGGQSFPRQQIHMGVWKCMYMSHIISMSLLGGIGPLECMWWWMSDIVSLSWVGGQSFPGHRVHMGVWKWGAESGCRTSSQCLY